MVTNPYRYDSLVSLTVEITYMADDVEFERKHPNLNQAEEQVEKIVRKNFFPKLEWMTNLKKLVLIKYGAFSEPKPVRSLLLDDLCAFIFTEERAPSSLECVWVEDFQLASSLFPHWQKGPLKKSYTERREIDGRYVYIDLSEPDNYQMALNDESIEHLSGIDEFPSPNQRGAYPRPYLPNLKHFRVLAYEEENQQVC